MQLIMTDSAAVPILHRACMHLNLLMHPPSAANGKYHCKSLTLPRATGAKESLDSVSLLATSTAQQHSMAHTLITQ